MDFQRRIKITAGQAWAVYDRVEAGTNEGPSTENWVLPVGFEEDFPPEMWYVATAHGPNSFYGSGFHTGIDVNIAKYPYGDSERLWGLSVRACADSVVHWVGRWSGNGCAVIRVEHQGAPLWVRYGHIVPVVRAGEVVKAGQRLGGFDDWSPAYNPNAGDHLHLDMRVKAFTTEWCTRPLSDWLDPVDVFKAHVDPAAVEAMVKR